MNCNYVMLGETPNNRILGMEWVDNDDFLDLCVPDPSDQFDGVIAWINKGTLEYGIHDIVGDNCTCHDTDREYKDNINTLKKMIEKWVVFEIEGQIFFYTNLLKTIKGR